MDIIRIHGLELDCIVGTWPHEREREQRVRLDLRFHADLSPAGRAGRISLTTDYDRAAHEIVALLRFRHYQLIEMAAEEVSAMLLGIHSGLMRVDVRIEKPGALEGRARAASVEVRRTRENFPRQAQTAPYGLCEVILDTREARLEILTIEPGQRTADVPAFAAQALAWLAEGQLSAFEAGVNEFIQISSAAPLPLHNPGPDRARLFRCWKRTPKSH